MSSDNESPAVVELPDDAIEAAACAISGYSAVQYERWRNTSKGQQHHDRAVAALTAAYPLIAARVRAEAVAERDAHWRQRLADLQAEYARIEEARERRLARAVAGERQRIAQRLEAVLNTSNLFAADAAYVEAVWQLRSELLSTFAAGSVPVATPQPDENEDDGPECGWLKEPGDTRHGCPLPAGHSGCCPPPNPVATPTEPEPLCEECCDGKHQRCPEQPGCCCARRLAAASPVPAEQPTTCEHGRTVAHYYGDDGDPGDYRYCDLGAGFRPVEQPAGDGEAFDRRAGEEAAGAELLGHRLTVGEAMSEAATDLAEALRRLGGSFTSGAGWLAAPPSLSNLTVAQMCDVLRLAIGGEMEADPQLCLSNLFLLSSNEIRRLRERAENAERGGADARAAVGRVQRLVRGRRPRRTLPLSDVVTALEGSALPWYERGDAAESRSVPTGQPEER